MMDFLRKIQKMFFFAVAIVLIVFFFFFGIFSTLSPASEENDPVIAKAIDGSDIHSSSLQKLLRLLTAGSQDEVIRKDFLQTGLGALLTRSYFEEFKEDLRLRALQAKRFRPYVHPEAPFLSAQAIWDQFYPDLSRHLAELKGEVEPSADTFVHLANLYIEQKKMPPELMRRILFYQMEQYSSIRMDPSLQYYDFSLFGYKSLRDWFGDKWLDKAAKFIWNAALVAEEKGFTVSRDEAKADLLFQPSLYQELQRLGMTEKELCETWQKVLLFRRYMNSIGDYVFVDHLTSGDLADYSQKSVAADVYTLPNALVLKTAEDFFALQYYLDTVTVPEKDLLVLPKAYRSADDLARKAPHFVETVFTAEVSCVSKDQLALRVSFKELLQWAVGHWDALARQFNALPATAASSAEQIAALEQISPPLRSQIDSWVRLRVVEEHPEWVEEALQAAQASEQTFSFFHDRVNVSYVKNPASFLASLSLAAAGDPDAKRDLSVYADGNLAFYRIAQVKQVADRQIRTLASMKQDGTLAKLVQSYLEKQYPRIREKHRTEFLAKDGDWKPFSEVKNQVGWAVYGDLCRAIETKEKLTEKTHDLHIRYRLAHAARHMLKEMRENLLELSVLEQFQLVRQEKTFKRSTMENQMVQELFTLAPNEWTSLYVLDQGQMCFAYLKETAVSSESQEDSLALNKELLAKEAMQILAKRLIHRMQGV